MLRNRLVVIAIGALILVGSCAQDDPAVTPPEETPGETEAAPADAEATVAVADSEHGDIVTDGGGRTLYVFLNDTDGKSTCNGPCAETWPAVEAENAAVAGEGIDEEMLGSTERDDGTMQLTYNEQPLYLYSGDQEAGDTNGQGVGDVWYVVGPDGEPIQE